MTLLQLDGPKLPRSTCVLCDGVGLVSLFKVRMPRQCPTCNGSGLCVSDDRWRDGIDLRAYQLGLRSRPSLKTVEG